MKRLRFFQEESGGKLVPMRIEAYMLPPKFKLNKDRHRIVEVCFSVKMDVKLAIACDENISVGWGDCETLDRQISRVDSRIEVEHTTADFFELRDSTRSCFRMKNVTATALLWKRDQGQTYLYFILPATVMNHVGIERFLASHYGAAIFIEFSEHVPEPSPDQTGGGIAQSLAQAVAEAVPEGTSVEVQIAGKKAKISGKRAAGGDS